MRCDITFLHYWNLEWEYFRFKIAKRLIRGGPSKVVSLGICRGVNIVFLHGESFLCFCFLSLESFLLLLLLLVLYYSYYYYYFSMVTTESYDEYERVRVSFFVLFLFVVVCLLFCRDVFVLGGGGVRGKPKGEQEGPPTDSFLGGAVRCHVVVFALPLFLGVSVVAFGNNKNPNIAPQMLRITHTHSLYIIYTPI